MDPATGDMLGIAADIISWIFLLSGSFLVLVTGIGLLRMPDFYARLHPAGITDTLAASLILIGLAFQIAPGMVTIKLGLILAFLLITSPVSSHAMASAALAAGMKPYTKKTASNANTTANNAERPSET